MLAQQAHPLWHVRVNDEFGEARQNVVNGVIGRPVKAGTR